MALRRVPESCPICGKEEALLRISMLVSEERLMFTVCRFCEWRIWETGAGTVPLDTVLRQVTRKDGRA